MKNLKITPGKWKQDGLYIDAPDGSLIATVNSEDSIENEANGKLIAKAPDLFEMVNLLLTQLPYGNEALQIKANNLIKSITG